MRSPKTAPDLGPWEQTFYSGLRTTLSKSMKGSNDDEQTQVLILYSSITGNTKKVAETIYETVSAYIKDTEIMELEPDSQIRFYDYSLIFAGTPVHHYLPPKPIDQIL